MTPNAHAPRHMPCDMGCQPDWHHDDCAIYLPSDAMPTPTFNLCETHGKCLDEDWRDDKGKSHAGCVGPPPPEILARFHALRDRTSIAPPRGSDV